MARKPKPVAARARRAGRVISATWLRLQLGPSPVPVSTQLAEVSDMRIPFLGVHGQVYYLKYGSSQDHEWKWQRTYDRRGGGSHRRPGVDASLLGESRTPIDPSAGRRQAPLRPRCLAS